MEIKRKVTKIEYGEPLKKIYLDNRYTIRIPEFTGDEVKPLLCTEFCDENGTVRATDRFIAMWCKDEIETFISYLKENDVTITTNTYSDSYIFENLQKIYHHYVRNGKDTIPTERNNDMDRINAINDEKLLVYSYDKMRVVLAYISFALMIGIKCYDPIISKHMDVYGFKPVTILNYFPSLDQIFGYGEWVKVDNYEMRYKKLFEPSSMDYRKKYKFMLVDNYYTTQQNLPYIALEYDDDNVINVAVGKSAASLIEELPIWAMDEEIECLSIHPHQLLSVIDRIYNVYVHDENDNNRIQLIPYQDNSGYFKIYNPDKLKLAELRLTYAEYMGLNCYDTFMTQFFDKKKKKIILPNDKDWEEFISDKEICTIPGTNILMLTKKTIDDPKPTGVGSLPSGSVRQIVDSINEFYRNK